MHVMDTNKSWVLAQKVNLVVHLDKLMATPISNGVHKGGVVAKFNWPLIRNSLPLFGPVVERLHPVYPIKTKG